MHHWRQILQDWVRAAAFVEVARPPGAAWSPVVSLPGCQGSPCWASWEHTACRKSIPFRSCSLCQGSTVPTKAPRGRPREGNEQQKPRSLADIHCPELSVTACWLLATGNQTQGHTRGICFNEENVVPDKKRDVIRKLERGILWS